MQPLGTQAILKALSVVVAAMVLTLSSCNREEKKTGTGTASPAGPGARVVRVVKVPDPAHLKLAVVTNSTSDFWKISGAGVRKYEKEAGIRVEFRMPPQGTIDEQNGIIDELISQGYNGIAVSVIKPNDQVSKINDAAKGTNVICFDSDCPKSNRLLYLGTDNFEAGKVLGRQIVRLLPHGGKIAVFVGRFSADNALQRLNGIEDAIRGHNIEIIAKKEDENDHDKALANVEEVINAHGDLNLVCGLWSYNGPAIATAIEHTGKKGVVLAAVFDEEQKTLDAIQAGVINCTVVQKPFQFGYLSSRWLHDLAIKGESVQLPEDGNIDTGVRVIDSTSVNEFAKELTELKAE